MSLYDTVGLFDETYGEICYNPHFFVACPRVIVKGIFKAKVLYIRLGYMLLGLIISCYKD